MRRIANGETIAPEDTSYDFRKDEADIKNRQRAEPRQTRPQDELTYETVRKGILLLPVVANLGP